MPTVGYSSYLVNAEEVAVGIIDTVLTDGGARLHERYLERKAFPFAAEAMNEALASRVQMCFVAHEDTEDMEGWDIEEEPTPGGIDSGARMCLVMRRPKMESTMQSRDTVESFRRSATRSKTLKQVGRKTIVQPRGDLFDTRAFSIKEEVSIDDEEEKLRSAKAAEDARRREAEEKKRLAAQRQEEECRRIEAMHEEMDRRKHTFDVNGNIIWVDDVRPEKLPKMQELVPYGLKKDQRPRGAPELEAPSVKKAPNTQKAAGRGGHAGRKQRSGGGSRKDREDEFPDTFTKLKHAQPPILDTMHVVPGVMLEFSGQSKPGPDVQKPKGQMSRKDYINLTEMQMSLDLDVPSPGNSEQQSGEGGNPTSPKDSPVKEGFPMATAKNEEQAATHSPGSKTSAQGTANAGTAASLQRGHKHPVPVGASQASNGQKTRDVEEKAPQKAPVAPPPYQTRARKFEAVGHLGRLPRFHPAPLGGPTNSRVVQPPLGATMGHGLVRSKSAKDDYFFPSPHPEPSVLSKRSRSEATLLRNAGQSVIGQTPSGNTSPVNLPSPSNKSRSTEKEVMSIDSPDHHGRFIADRHSPAYRNARQQLFPRHDASGGHSRHGHF